MGYDSDDWWEEFHEPGGEYYDHEFEGAYGSEAKTLASTQAQLCAACVAHLCVFCSKKRVAWILLLGTARC